VQPPESRSPRPYVEATRATLVNLIERVTNAGGAFTVLASLRTFDLRNSVRLEYVLPARTAGTDEFRREEFKAIEHFWVPALAEDELLQLATAAPALHAVLQTATPAVRELAALPFNLGLLAGPVLGAGLGADRLEAIGTQPALLDAYWRERVQVGDAGDDREHLLRRACEAMVAARRLYADRRPEPAATAPTQASRSSRTSPSRGQGGVSISPRWVPALDENQAYPDHD
jgi:hypothetical protein